MIKCLVAGVALTIGLTGYAIAQETVRRHRHRHDHSQHMLQPSGSPGVQLGPSFELDQPLDLLVPRRRRSHPLCTDKRFLRRPLSASAWRVSSPDLMPVRFATISATRRKCAGFRLLSDDRVDSAPNGVCAAGRSLSSTHLKGPSMAKSIRNLAAVTRVGLDRAKAAATRTVNLNPARARRPRRPLPDCVGPAARRRPR